MHATAYLFLALATLFWAANGVAGKLAVGHVSPMVIVMLRWFVVMIVLVSLSGRHLRNDWRVISANWVYLLTLGCVGFTIFSVALYYALIYTSAVNTSILQGAMPLFIFAASFVMFRSRATYAQIFGFMLSFIGVMMIALRGDWHNLVTLNVNFGDALMLVAVIAYGTYTAALRAKPPLHWTSLMIMLCLGASLTSLPFLIAEARAGALIWPDLQGWAVIAFIILFPSLLSQVFYIRAVEMVGANRAGLFMNLLPLWGALLAVTVVGEDFHTYHALGLFLILAGIAVGERRSFVRT